MVAATPEVPPSLTPSASSASAAPRTSGIHAKSGRSLPRVVLVDIDAHSGSLLARYLETRGWSVTHVTDARSVIRRWGTALGAPFLVVNSDGEDPHVFELLAALSARTMSVRVIVCVPPLLANMLSRSGGLGIERVLASPCRFSELAGALQEFSNDLATTLEAP